MFTGHMIDNLIRTVEQTEQQMQLQLQQTWAEPEPVPHALLVADVYQWHGMERAIVGAA
jgi:hypothetical protein